MALLAVGWGLSVVGSGGVLALSGGAAVAVLLGSRHAFDADHVATIDDCSRLMVQRGDRPVAGPGVIGVFRKIRMLVPRGVRRVVPVRHLDVADVEIARHPGRRADFAIGRAENRAHRLLQDQR